MSDSPRLVTCGLPYTNGSCHLGHLRTYVPADMYVRYLRHRGEEVVFICGSDNHGTPIVVSAEAQGTTPAELSRRYHDHFDATFRRMNVVFDHFGMTDGPTNHNRTQAIVKVLEERGYIYKERVQQSYCPNCQRFLPDRYVKGLCPHCGAEARGDECDQGCGKHLEPGEIREPICTVCNTEAQLREQEHYFFRLSTFAPFLVEHLAGLQGTANARNYAQGWVREGLRDWCITRTLDWGVRYPGRDDLVVYVWVDAPIGYISFTEEWAAAHGTDWKRYWCGGGEITHFIGGDITYHHCIFWPALLKAAGFGLPTAVVASGMLKVDDHKFSKSRGYVVWTNEDYLDLGLPADCLRYYLLAYTSHTKELNFSWRAFADRVNNELVNTFGNFVHRTLHFAHTRLGGVPTCSPREDVIVEIRQAVTAIDEAMEAYEFKTAVDAVLALAASGNTLIQSNAPWKLIKTDPDAAAQVIADALQVVRALAVLIDPVMPETGRTIWEMLGLPDSIENERLEDCTRPLPPGPLAMPTPLFSRIEETQVERLDALLAARVAEAESRSCTPSDEGPLLSFDEFARMELVVGRVITAEPIKKSKKLLRLVVDIGTEERQIVAGIAQFYTPDELVGTDVIVIANLAPAVLFGIESRGMVLAAGDEASILVPKRTVAPGTRVR